MENLENPWKTVQSRLEPGEDKPKPDVPGWLEKAGIKDGLVVCWLDHAVLFGRVSNCKLEFQESVVPDYSYLQQLRAFNENRELFAWKTGPGYRYRVRIDGEGEDVEVLDAEQVVWGTVSKPLGKDFSRVSDPERGIELIVPLDNLQLSADLRLVLETRNYLDYGPETGQAGFVDCRFVKLCPSPINREAKS